MIKTLAIVWGQKYPRRYKRNKTAATPACLFSFGFWVSPAKHGEGWRGWRHSKQTHHTMANKGTENDS